MKKIFATALALAISASAGTAQAETTNLADSFYKYGYWGLGLSKANLSSNIGGAPDFSFLEVNLILGYQFSEYMGVEALILVPTSGKKDALASHIEGVKVEAEYASYGAYLTAKSKGPFYAKARIGFAESEVRYGASGYKDETNGDIGLGYGIGAGYKHGRISYDLEYLALPKVDSSYFTDETFTVKNMMFNVTVEF